MKKRIKRILAVTIIIAIVLIISYLIYTGGASRCVETLL